MFFERAATATLGVLVCTENVVKTLARCKNTHKHNYIAVAAIIFLPLDFLCWICTEERRREAWVWVALLLPCAKAISSFTVHPWISNFNKKKIFIYFSRLHFVHLRCDIVSYWITKENFVFWYIFAFLEYFDFVLLPFARKYWITCYGGVDKDRILFYILRQWLFWSRITG